MNVQGNESLAVACVLGLGFSSSKFELVVGVLARHLVPCGSFSAPRSDSRNSTIRPTVPVPLPVTVAAETAAHRVADRNGRVRWTNTHKRYRQTRYQARFRCSRWGRRQRSMGRRAAASAPSPGGLWLPPFRQGTRTRRTQDCPEDAGFQYLE